MTHFKISTAFVCSLILLSGCTTNLWEEGKETAANIQTSVEQNINIAEKQYEKAKERALEEYAKAKKEYENAKQKAEEVQDDITEAKAEFDKKLQQLQEAQKALEELFSTGENVNTTAQPAGNISEESISE